MISEISSENKYINTARYFGILVSNSNKDLLENDYKDIEKFILDSTLYVSESRSAEGILTWLKKYGAALSPSKLRRLVQSKYPCDTAVLGAFLDFVETHHNLDFKIVKKVCVKKNKITSINPKIPPQMYRSPNPIFKKWSLLAPNYLCEDKFLESAETLLKRCIELRNRLLMGSVVHADISSLLETTKEELSNYEIAKRISNLRASVNRALELYPDRNVFNLRLDLKIKK